jgi:endonuclease/exonuclease/phosphatase (EEP) superfamily protein YafD
MELLRQFGLLLAVLCAAVSLAALMGAFSGALDVLTHLTPITLAAGLVALALDLAAHAGAPAIGLSLLAIGAGLILVAPELAFGRRPGGAAGEPRLKLIQFNLWAWNADLSASLAWLEREDADIVVLQEAVGAARGAAAALERLYPYRSPRASFASSATILSKAAPLDEGLLFSTAGGRRAAGAWARFGDRETGFTVVGVHLSWPMPVKIQQAQMRRLAEDLAKFDPSTTILAGDLNSTPWSFALRRLDARLALRRRTRALATWPARRLGYLPLSFPFAILPIDHVYAGEGWETVAVRAGPRLGSDHLAVVVTLARRPRAEAPFVSTLARRDTSPSRGR